jgi:hypothetical protein
MKQNFTVRQGALDGVKAFQKRLAVLAAPRHNASRSPSLASNRAETCNAPHSPQLVQQSLHVR